jgi:hypothetical protein
MTIDVRKDMRVIPRWRNLVRGLSRPEPVVFPSGQRTAGPRGRWADLYGATPGSCTGRHTVEATLVQHGTRGLPRQERSQAGEVGAVDVCPGQPQAFEPAGFHHSEPLGTLNFPVH